MYTPRTLVEAIPNAFIHHSALQNRDFGHTYDRLRALVKALAPSSTACTYTPRAGVVESSLIHAYHCGDGVRAEAAGFGGFNFTMVFPSKILTSDYNSKIQLAITIVKFVVS
jgi:hypothetical protein